MKCPCCKGEGGEYDAILWNGVGGGPYYPCEYCGGAGRVGLLAWLRWRLWDLGDRWRYTRHQHR